VSLPKGRLPPGGAEALLKTICKALKKGKKWQEKQARIKKNKQ